MSNQDDRSTIAVNACLTDCKPIRSTRITFKQATLPKARQKGNLPTKMCPICERPFTWRKKWERDWENVKYCSDRCRREAKSKQTL